MKEIDESILLSYLEEQAGEEECQKVEEWYNASPENRKALEQLYYTLFVGDRLAAMNAVDTENSLKEFKARLRKKEAAPHNRPTTWKRFATLAAAFLAGIILAGVAVWSLYPDDVSRYTVSTEPGQRAQVLLPDGSKVWLNSSTSLTYRTSFRSSLRQVDLKGEAYFEVTPDKHLPFTVLCKDIRVCVLGTKFNVRARSDEYRVVTTLLKGSVQVDAPRPASDSPQADTPSDTAKSFLLKPGQTLDMNTHTYQAELIEYTRPDEILQWIKGKLHFEQTRLEDITRNLEKHYDARFVYFQESLKDECFTCEFSTDDSLIDILDVLAATGKLGYEKTGRVIKLKMGS